MNDSQIVDNDAMNTNSVSHLLSQIAFLLKQKLQNRNEWTTQTLTVYI